MSIFFTADTHFGHSNIIRYCGRPFETKEEHDEVLIDNWNKTLSKGDHIYHLGDFGFGAPDYLYRITQRLRGSIHFIMGNHDHRSFIKKEFVQKRFTFIKEIHCGSIQERGETYRIFLSHYAHRTWPFCNYGSYHFFGHSHGNMPPLGRSCDVGVDVWNYTPVALSRLVEFLKDFDTTEYSKVPNKKDKK